MKRVLVQIHLWVGLILSPPFVLLGLTGSILVFDQDIARAMWLQKRGAHARAEADELENA